MGPNLKSVIWITGNSSSGKTTVARSLQNQLLASGTNCIFLDGDDLRSIMAEKWGFEQKDRLELAKTYLQLASHISSQGNIVIISAVAMFNEIFDWFQTNVENPILVYLDVPLSERLLRDGNTKGVYSQLKAQKIKYDIPSNPSLTIKNYGDITPEQSAKLIISEMQNLRQWSRSDKGRSKYWNKVYGGEQLPQYPTPFAQWVVKQFNSEQKIIDVGCGNGRDSLFFSSIGHQVVGIDVSENAIKSNLNSDVNGNLEFHCCDLEAYFSKLTQGKFDVIYSRFSIHAMTEWEETSTINAAQKLLKEGGTLFIETRSIKDKLANQGDIISHSERIKGHYRRFGESKLLSDKIASAGFLIEQLIEEKDLAVYKNENPIVIRIKAKKISV